jgi:sterol desaturase/sphingolipid hydroxylase (fatty acid hydroxylase superfamily)
MRTLAIDYFVTLGCAAGLSAIFFAIERLNRIGRRSLADSLGNYIYLPFYVGSVCLLQAAAGPFFSRLAARSGGLAGAIEGRGVVAEILAGTMFVVAWDVWQYWVHRWQHTSPLLWESHRLHHSDELMSSSSQTRHHVLSQVVNLACYTPLLLLFGPFRLNAVAGFLMFRLWGFVNHANVRLSLGPLTSVIAGPQWHRIHHSTQPQHLDKNFATFFPLIDRVFGTYYEPGRDEYPPTGLVHEAPESFLVQATISPFRRWYRMARRSRSHDAASPPASVTPTCSSSRA